MFSWETKEHQTRVFIEWSFEIMSDFLLPLDIVLFNSGTWWRWLVFHNYFSLCQGSNSTSEISASLLSANTINWYQNRKQMVILSLLDGMQYKSTIALPSNSCLQGMIAFMLLRKEFHVTINLGGLQSLFSIFSFFLYMMYLKILQ